MIDIHNPHESIHSWRDIVIHLAIVIVGILIAIGLEQGVEGLHQRHQAAELRENLHAESQQVLFDSRRCIASTDYSITWLSTRIEQVKQTVWRHQPLAATVPFNPPYCASPDIPIWRTAKESGLAFHLSKGEVTGYSEVEYVATRNTLSAADALKADYDVRQFLLTLPESADGHPDLSVASTADLRQYLTLLSAQLETTRRYLVWLHLVKGADEAVVHGETRLNAIYAAETRDLKSDSILNSPSAD